MTVAGRRLLWFFRTTPERGGRVHPRAFDARLTERIVEAFVARIEAEAHARGVAGDLDPAPSEPWEAS